MTNYLQDLMEIEDQKFLAFVEAIISERVAPAPNERPTCGTANQRAAPVIAEENREEILKWVQEFATAYSDTEK